MNKLIIYGANYFDLLKLVDAINREKPTWEVLGFIDDTPEKQGQVFWDLPVLGGRSEIDKYNRSNDIYFFNNVCGHWARSQLIAGLLDEYHCQIASLIHPNIDMYHVTMGRGCILPEGCVVGSKSIIGNFVTVRLGTIISHDVTIESHSFIGPGVTIGSGAVLEKGAFIGAGATIMFNRRIGHGAIVGAGSLVNHNIEEKIVVAGVPAKKMRKRFTDE